MTLHSTLQLVKDTTLVKSNTAVDRALVYNTVAPDYYTTYIYSTNMHMVVAKIWPLAAVSMSLLTPDMQTNWLYVIDNQCPMRKAGNSEMDGRIDQLIGSRMPVLPASLTVHELGNADFFNYKIMPDGSVKTMELKFTSEHGIVLASFILSLTLAVFGCGIFMTAAIAAYRHVHEARCIYINNQRHLCVAKKLVGDPSKPDNRSEHEKLAAAKQAKSHLNNVLDINLFSANVNTHSTAPKKDVLDATLQFFEVPTLLFDFMTRQFANSLVSYLEKIPTAPSQFTTKKCSNFRLISITLEEFNNQYDRYCKKFGLNTLILEENLEILKPYHLTLTEHVDKFSKGYTNIRHMTEKEKARYNKAHKGSVKQGPDHPITDYINEEYIYSQFEGDYVLDNDFIQGYDLYCLQKKISWQKKGKIIGSIDLKNFKAIRNTEIPQTFINGIARKVKIISTGNAEEMKEDVYFTN